MPTISNFATDGTLIARAVSAFAQQEYTDARYLVGSQLVGSDARISVSDEDYYGTIRWDETLGANSYTQAAVTGATNVNYGDESTTEGLTTDFSTDFAEYIKSNRNVGASDYNLTQVITRREGAIAKLGSQLGRVRARDEDAALLSVIKGVVTKEAATGTAGNATNGFGQALGNPLNDSAGFYFDVNGPQAVENSSQTNNSSAGSKTLIDTSAAGGKAAKRIFEAMAAGYGDLEPEFMYLIVDPETFYDMRLANLLDEQDRVTDGNIQFDTLLQGKIRVFQTRTDLGSYESSAAAAANDRVNKGSTKMSLLCLPGSISMVDLPMVNPVEFDSDASVGKGTGNREVWYRWGYVQHPRGYTWAGSKTAFATNATYEASASWTRKENVGNLGMLPIFHA